MNHKINFLVIILFIIFFFFGVAVYGYMSSGEKNLDSYKVSVICEAQNNESWIVLKQGMETAAKEFNIKVNFIIVSPDSDISETINVVRREIQNGSKGIILNLSNNSVLVKKLDELLTDTQVVLVESKIAIARGYSYVSSDNYAMGLNLGEILLEDRKETESVGVIAGKADKDSNEERKRGFFDAFGEENVKWLLEEEREIDRGDIKSILKKSPVDYIVTLNTTVTGEALDAIRGKKEIHEKIYGFGNTEKIVYYLDKGIVNTLVVSDEYTMGYFSMKNVYYRLNYRNAEDAGEISYFVVNRENLYQEEIQKFMFPMVQ